MNPDTLCESVRPRLMAAMDGELEAAPAADREHLSGCPSCQQWLLELQHADARLQRLAYPDVQRDLWAALEPRILESEARPNIAPRLWIIGAIVLAWRVLQLWIELPLPALHAFVPMAAVVAALWSLAGDPLAVKTFAPELQKRGA